MDIDNIFGKIEGNADKLGALLGFFGGASNEADAFWGSGGHAFDELQMNITDLLKQPHMPDFGHVMYDLTSGYQRQTFFTAVMAWIGGYVLKEVDMDPKITKLGSALGKAGFGAIMGTLAYAIVKRSGTAHSPDGGARDSSGGFSTGWGQ